MREWTLMFTSQRPCLYLGPQDYSVSNYGKFEFFASELVGNSKRISLLNPFFLKHLNFLATKQQINAYREKPVLKFSFLSRVKGHRIVFFFRITFYSIKKISWKVYRKYIQKYYCKVNIKSILHDIQLSYSKQGFFREFYMLNFCNSMSKSLLYAMRGQFHFKHLSVLMKCFNFNFSCMKTKLLKLKI